MMDNGLESFFYNSFPSYRPKKNWDDLCNGDEFYLIFRILFMNPRGEDKLKSHDWMIMQPWFPCIAVSGKAII